MPLPSLSALKGEAHMLRAEARAAGKNLKQQPALDLVANRHGFRNWDLLKAASERHSPPPPPSPFAPDLQRGCVEARWKPELNLQVPCFWTPRIRFGRVDALLSEETMRKLAARFPEKFSFRGDILLVTNRPDSFAGLAGFGPGQAPPLLTQHDGAALKLYWGSEEDWGPVQAKGAAAKLLEETVRDHSKRRPSVVAR